MTFEEMKTFLKRNGVDFEKVEFRFEIFSSLKGDKYQFFLETTDIDIPVPQIVAKTYKFKLEEIPNLIIEGYLRSMIVEYQIYFKV